MKKKICLSLCILFFVLASSAAQKTPAPTDSKTLARYLPELSGYTTWGKILTTKTVIRKQQFPIAIKTMLKGGEKIIVKILDAHYKPNAYEEYYFLAEENKETDYTKEIFYSVLHKGHIIYIHQNKVLKIVKGVALIGNRYVVTVIVRPANSSAAVEEVFGAMKLKKLATLNNPLRFRNKTYRRPKPKPMPETEEDY